MTKITEEYIEEEITKHYNALAKTDTSSLRELINETRLRTYIFVALYQDKYKTLMQRLFPFAKTMLKE